MKITRIYVRLMAISLSRKLIDYIKLSKPRVISLLDLAAIAGFVLGLPKAINITSIIVSFLAVIIGGSLASGGGMIINGGLEIEKDKKMKRTSWRPTVKGEVGRKEAYAIGSIFIVVGTLIGFLANPLTALFIALGAFIYVVIYSIWLKPRTWWNIVIGGFAGSAAAWAGFAASSGSFTLLSFLLGFLIFMWTPGHFWSLALRFRDDYKNAEIPMLPVLTDERTSAKAIAISNALMVPFALLIGLYAGLIYLIVSTIVSAFLLYVSVKLYLNPTADEAWESFKLSSPYLAIILLTLIIVKLI
ncbi:protoheme IX farnesyltransferase [Sulfurisphaera tokodaii str. 7]|uniref:Protoheme IX farnesyltransferase n=3 Tax=Sulfurisphaera TaxID=69655 RepID=COXX_SULTO|nr:RecName: Full=Protoheme IX farnesyltransferase; AltName: Full=Heme B farnesyltransferase; AltName: Full=Heme O synthase [Sulfurisphaera tokodaii str. 7]BAK54610.1 protoheme IX farnesyltransferase [Sulfurisphaera tokodaii str. 7]